MRLDVPSPFQRAALAVLVASCLWAYAQGARAAEPEGGKARDEVERRAIDESFHVVQPGESLGAIALAAGVSLEAIVELNGLDDPDRVQAGRKLRLPVAGVAAVAPRDGQGGEPPRSSREPRLTEDGVILRVPRKFTLTRIAELYGVSVAAVAKANKLARPYRLRAGQKLLIPGATEIIELVPPPPCFKPAVELYRVQNAASEQVPLTFCNGKVNPVAVEIVSRVSGPLRSAKASPLLAARLVELLQVVADRYPGKRLEVVSGYRPQGTSGHESYHSRAQAIDFRVTGVPNRALVEVLRRFENVGVGYYPNSVFVHLDTREKATFWVDYSRPGEKAIYGRAGLTRAEVEAIRQSRLAATAGGVEVAEGSAAEAREAEGETAEHLDVTVEPVETAAASTTAIAMTDQASSL